MTTGRLLALSLVTVATQQRAQVGAVTVKPGQIFTNVREDEALLGWDCVSIYDAPYQYQVKQSDIDTGDRTHTHIFVGALRHSYYVVAALDDIDVALERTTDPYRAHSSNASAVWWYFTSASDYKTFGFSPKDDSLSGGYRGCDQRLSWPVDSYHDGLRAGCTTNFYYANEYAAKGFRKVVKYCSQPTPAPTLSLGPTVSPSPTASPTSLGQFFLNVEIDAVPPPGEFGFACETVYNESYADNTTTADIDRGAEFIASRGYTHVVVGAVGPGDADRYQIAAVDMIDAVLLRTSSTSRAQQLTANSQVYWYHVPGKSFGFAPMRIIQLNDADIYSSNDCDYRLSWYIDKQLGGHRSGCTTGLDSDTTHKKVVRYCRSIDSAAPSTSPTASLAPTPSAQPTSNEPPPKPAPTFVGEIYNNTAEDTILAGRGFRCQTVYDAPYDFHTHLADIDKRATLPEYTHILVGARGEATAGSGTSSPHYVVAAFDLIDVALTPTYWYTVAHRSTDKSSVWWYQYNERAFGFSPTEAINLIRYGIVDDEVTDCQLRLSWSLTSSPFGRYGCSHTTFGHSPSYVAPFHKVVKYCAAAGPTAAPTVAAPRTPTRDDENIYGNAMNSTDHGNATPPTLTQTSSHANKAKQDWNLGGVRLVVVIVSCLAVRLAVLGLLRHFRAKKSKKTLVIEIAVPHVAHQESV